MDEVKYIDKDIVERRIISYCIDLIIYNIIILILFKVIIVIEENMLMMYDEEIESLSLLIFLFCLIGVDIIYYYVCYMRYNTTIGGLICNIKLVDKNNKELLRKKKLKRSIFKVVTKYFMFGILFVPTCFDKTDIWYDKILGVNTIFDENEDEKIKRIILALKFNYKIIISVFIFTSPLFILVLFINLIAFSSISTMFEEIYLYFLIVSMILIYLFIIVILANTILSPFKEKYIENFIEKNKIEHIVIDINNESERLKSEEKKDISKLEILKKDNIISDRANAFYMDSIIEFFIFLIIIVVIRLEYNWFVIILLLDIIYYFLCNIVFSTTIGGVVFKIITVNKEGKKLSIIENVLRSIMKVLSKSLLCIPFIFSYMDKEEMWYDKILKTRVISKEEYKM